MLDTINPKRVLMWYIMFCTVALEAAYIAEYIYKIMPCQICLYQRYMFMIIIMVAVLSISIQQTKFYRWSYLIISLLFLQNAAIAGYQVLVEQKVLSPPGLCHAPKINADNVDDLRAQLKQVKVIPCDVPAWKFMGISMAGYNLAYSLLLAGFGLLLVIRYPNRKFIKS